MKLAVIAAFATTLLAQPTLADDSAFLKSLSGTWSGSGSATTKIGAKPLQVSCKFKTTSTSGALSMSGSCRGFVVVRRTISATLRNKAGRYTGTYIGPSGRPSSLSGARDGNSVNLAITWIRVINGDKSAQPTIKKVGARGLQLRTTDRDPRTGKTIVDAITRASVFGLRRNPGTLIS
ncbi:hypothetical protein DEM27_23750 [Metarhizobium album]|uniref:DUF2147 domain-containing protein n=1 Tax=Metarhizobium album TaxID=2182425 RepID=A0A2U2DKU5_9HYPH|nr:hypothetical protein [Rhizobium album]PWE53929.1 hypothetical protein DEM27_23750 [Rhizobium album]